MGLFLSTPWTRAAGQLWGRPLLSWLRSQIPGQKPRAGEAVALTQTRCHLLSAHVHQALYPTCCCISTATTRSGCNCLHLTDEQTEALGDYMMYPRLHVEHVVEPGSPGHWPRRCSQHTAERTRLLPSVPSSLSSLSPSPTPPPHLPELPSSCFALVLSAQRLHSRTEAPHCCYAMGSSDVRTPSQNNIRKSTQ